MTPDPLHMIGALVQPGALVVPGSVRKRCATCARGVWIAPTGQDRVEQAEPGQVVRFYCMPCGVEMMRNDPEREVEPIRVEQVQEMVNFLRRN